MSDDKTSQNDGDKGGEKDNSGDDLRAELETITRKMKRYEEDIAYKDREIERLKEQKSTRDKALDKNSDPDFLKTKEKELREEFALREEKLKTDLDKTAKELKAERVVKSGMIEAAKHFNQDALELIQGIIEHSCDLEDGQIVVKNDKGETRYSENNSRIPMSLSELMVELTKKYPSCAKPTGRQGSDTNEGQKFDKSKGQVGKAYNPEDLAGVGLARQAQMIQEGDVDSARRLLKAVSQSILQ